MKGKAVDRLIVGVNQSLPGTSFHTLMTFPRAVWFTLLRTEGKEGCGEESQGVSPDFSQELGSPGVRAKDGAVRLLARSIGSADGADSRP